MEIKTTDLEGAALDWAVAQIDPQCEGLEWMPSEAGPMVGYGDIGGQREPCLFLSSGVRLHMRIRLQREDIFAYAPSTDWGQGGPLIDGHTVEFATHPDGLEAFTQTKTRGMTGKTHLIAAMRAIVAAELGDEVGVPDDLAT